MPRTRPWAVSTSGNSSAAVTARAARGKAAPATPRAAAASRDRRLACMVSSRRFLFVVRVDCRRCADLRKPRSEVVEGYARLLAFGPLEHHAGIALPGRQGLASVFPVRRLLQGEVVARFAAGAAFEQAAGNVD